MSNHPPPYVLRLTFYALRTLLCFLVALQHLDHQRVPSITRQRPRAPHQNLFGLDEVLTRVPPDAGMDVGVHTDRVAGARFHTHATVDAAQSIDLVAQREFFHVGIWVLTRLDVDAIGRTSGRAQKTGSAAHRPVLFER